MKKQPDKLSVALPIILGLIFMVLSGAGVISCAIYEPDMLAFPIIPFAISLVIIGVGICKNIRRKHLESLVAKENESTCVVEEYTTSGFIYNTYYCVIVTYKGKSNQVYYQKIPCNLDDYNKFTKGTEIACYIKDEDCFVPYSSISKKKYN